MSTIEELEARVQALEVDRASVRGAVRELASDLDTFRYETRREMSSIQTTLAGHGRRLGDLDAKIDTLIDGQAEIRRLLLPKAGTE